MAAANAERSSGEERMLKSATAQSIRSAEVKQIALSAGEMLLSMSVLLLSWAADATDATHAHASTNAEAKSTCERVAEKRRALQMGRTGHSDDDVGCEGETQSSGGVERGGGGALEQTLRHTAQARRQWGRRRDTEHGGEGSREHCSDALQRLAAAGKRQGELRKGSSERCPGPSFGEEHEQCVAALAALQDRLDAMQRAWSEIVYLFRKVGRILAEGWDSASSGRKVISGLSLS